ncbi:Hypothetical protein HVR_LOCUS435 [uncultured virus]|nr:Hypothetical protein HVR_LOCUS435 [uncultured virus]
MDKYIIIEYTPESLLEAAKYFAGLYSQLSGQQLALISLADQPENIIKAHIDNGTIINSSDKIRKRKFNPPHQSITSSKMERLFSLLSKFIEDKCIIGPSYSIKGSVLLGAFSEEIGEPIENKHEFPSLMNMIMEPHNNISKKSTCKGVVYMGITLKPPIRATQLVLIPTSLNH